MQQHTRRARDKTIFALPEGTEKVLQTLLFYRNKLSEDGDLAGDYYICISRLQMNEKQVLHTHRLLLHNLIDKLGKSRTERSFVQPPAGSRLSCPIT